MHKKIRLIEVKSEIGAGTRGASMGPDALKVAALDYGSNLFYKLPSAEVPVENHLLFETHGSAYAKRIRGIINIYERLSKTVSDTLKNKEFPIVLAGDHSTAGGTIAGIKMAFPKTRLGGSSGSMRMRICILPTPHRQETCMVCRWRRPWVRTISPIS